MLSRLLLRIPPRLRELGRVPVIGPLFRSITRTVVPQDSRIWVQIRGGPARGLWMSLNPRTGGALYEGIHEPTVQAALVEMLKAGMVFYDIGAHGGFFTMLAAQIVGDSGAVYAFEPDPDVCEKLRGNIAKNRLTNVRVIEAAVHSASGLAHFVRADPSISPERGLGRVRVHDAAAVIVKGVSLDDFVARHQPPDIVKCDVEGTEGDVLNGARGLLRRHRPIVICEIHAGAGPRQAIQVLTELTYAIHWIDHTHVLALPDGPHA